MAIWLVVWFGAEWFSQRAFSRSVAADIDMLQHGTNEQQEGTQCKLFSIKDSELD